MTLLGGLTPAQFLRNYWQKKPLLIRQAIPNFASLFSRDTLLDMASQDEIESRLITHFKQQWRMENGPLSKLPSVKQSGWTLLMQGMNLHDDTADHLLRQFRFIPDARLDDLMISFATDAGGVGPHVDSYDVFLLQAQGQRRWRISSQKDLSFVENMPLRILKNFQPEQEFVLDPGDMLYLPPHYAHDGVAVGECMTYSIGFRAPAYQELGEAFLQFMADTIDLEGRYADPDLEPSRHPAELSRAMLSQVTTQLNKVQFTEMDITIFMGEFLSELKPTVFFNPPRPAWSVARFNKSAVKQGIKLSRKTKMLYRKNHVFINGESFAMNREDKKLLVDLADVRELEGMTIAAASENVMDAFYIWYTDGWVVLR